MTNGGEIIKVRLLKLISTIIVFSIFFSFQFPVFAISFPTESEAYERITELRNTYPEGTPWDNSNYYGWRGGIYSGGYGCAGFAFMLSDAAFGDFPATKSLDICYENLRVGDILRINSDSHSVVILEIHESYITIAEGNYNRSVHWGRTLSKDVVMQADYYITRYSDLPPLESDSLLFINANKISVLDNVITENCSLICIGYSDNERFIESQIITNVEVGKTIGLSWNNGGKISKYKAFLVNADLIPVCKSALLEIT